MVDGAAVGTRIDLPRVLPLVALVACGTAGADVASTESAATVAFHPRRFADVEAALGGTIPFPPETLVERLLALEPESRVSATVFPHARSLERSVTDFRAPRSVVLWNDLASGAPYRVFLGYTPKAEQLEVIAWNWQRRRFDFFFVEDYAAGKTARVVTPPRELCTACHQGGGPIFAVAPWNESTLNGTVKRQVEAQSEDPFSRWLVGLGEGSGRMRVSPAVIDFEVRQSTRMLQSQRVCASACGGDLECRKGLLLAALFETIEPLSSSNVGAAWRASMTRAMEPVWPADRFTIVSDSLADRRVDLTRPLRFDTREDPLLWRKANHPKTPADAASDAMLASYGDCFSFEQEEIRRLEGWGPARIEAAMATAQATELVARWLPSEGAVVAALADAIDDPRPTVAAAPVPWTAEVEPAPDGSPAPGGASATKLFEHYCGYCHAGPATRPQILPLGDAAALARYVGDAGRTVRGLLDPAHPVMPPRGALQPTADERQRMLDSLR